MQWLRDRRLRTKILLSVVVAVIGTGAVSWSGIIAARSASDEADHIYTRVALPLVDLAAIRDAEGDAPVGLRDYVLGAPGNPGRRPCCSRSTPPSRPPAPATPARASSWSLMR